jgi:hypothetical protein
MAGIGLIEACRIPRAVLQRRDAARCDGCGLLTNQGEHIELQ